MNKKIIKNYIFRFTCFIITIIAFILIASFFITITFKLIKIISSIITYSNDFLFDESLISALIGSMIISILSVIISFVISIPLTIFINLNSIKYKSFITTFRKWIKTINEIPALIYGIFGLIIMIIFNLNYSLLTGIVAMTIIIIPYSLMIYDNFLNNIDKNYIIFIKYPGLSNKYNKFFLIIKKSYKAIIITFLMSFLNVFGNAATVLFTTGFSDFIPKRITDPVATIPLYIIFNINSPLISEKEKVDLAVFILFMIIVITYILIKIFSKNLYGKYFKK